MRLTLVLYPNLSNSILSLPIFSNPIHLNTILFNPIQSFIILFFAFQFFQIIFYPINFKPIFFNPVKDNPFKSIGVMFSLTNKLTNSFFQIGKFYLRHISGRSQAFIRQILGISYTYLWSITGNCIRYNKADWDLRSREPDYL